MIPIVTPAEMAAIDAAAPEPVEVLIDRAGAAVARSARRLLGGTYGRRVVVVAGAGNNGADGRIAATRLARAGAAVQVVDALDAPPVLAPCDLVIDAAYGTGLVRPYVAPAVDARPLVLAVDIASGVDGSTGTVLGRPLHADATVTFAALKPGLVLEPGASVSGSIEVADIGLDVSGARAHLVTGVDVAGRVPQRPVDSHKWRAACLVVAGSSGMTGAGALASAAALRSGAGYVLWCCPGGEAAVGPVEAVRVEELDGIDLERFASAVVGPGMGRSEAAARRVGRLLADFAGPLVLDGDALALVGPAERLRERRAPTILTPHDGEFERLAGARPGADRFAAVRELAARSGAVVLSKGPTTLVAAPDGTVRAVRSGDQRLATAGTGDVLAGIIGAFAARGAAPLDAAAVGAVVHGAAAEEVGTAILVAGDLIERLPTVLPGTGEG